MVKHGAMPTDAPLVVRRPASAIGPLLGLAIVLTIAGVFVLGSMLA